MADPQINPEEQALRRRARRRLVGSLALALLTVVVLPMIFEPEPKPLGDDVEIVIPGQDTPFKPSAIPGATMPQVAPKAAPAAQVAAPAAPAPLAAPAKTMPPATPEQGKIKPIEAAKSQAAPVMPIKPTDKAEPKTPAKPEAKPVAKPENKPEAKAESKPAAKPEAKTEAKPDAKAGDAPAAGYYLQLGAFGAESNARQLAEKARKAGYQATVLPGKDTFKVRVGPYPGKDKAVEAEDKLKARGFTPVLVAP